MKSEPRHEAKILHIPQDRDRQSCAQGPEPLETPGDYWRVYGNRVLLVVIAALAVFLAVRYYRDKQTNDEIEVSSALENTRSQMGTLQQMLLSAGQSGTPDAIQGRDRVVTQLGESINSILTISKDPKIIARGYLAKGDLKWELANAPDPAGATTRPELKVQNRVGLLDEAREAYSHVLESPFNDDQLNLFSARMGLAAIAENNHKWDDAKTQYQAIADSSMPSSFKELAHKRIVELPGLEKTPVLNAAPEMEDLKSVLDSMAKSTQPGTTLPSSAIIPTTAMSDMMMSPGAMPPTSMPATTMPSAAPTPVTQPATTQSANASTTRNLAASFFLVAKTQDLGNTVFNCPTTQPSPEPFSQFN